MNPDLDTLSDRPPRRGTPRLHVEDAGGSPPAPLVLTGELDGTDEPTLHAAVAAVLHRHPGAQVALDATGLAFLDSGGVRALLTCRDHAHRRGGGLVIVAAGPMPYQVLEITGLLEIFGSPRRAAG